MLGERSNLDDETAKFLQKRVKDRLEQEGVSETITAEEAAQNAVRDAIAEGKLNDDFVLNAADRGDRAAVACALAALAGVPKATVDRVLISQSGKAITALVWRAKLAMRVAVKVQSAIAHLPGSKMVMARNGVDFPLSQEEMSWHLSYFGISA
jgi:hypothetical protein